MVFMVLGLLGGFIYLSVHFLKLKDRVEYLEANVFFDKEWWSDEKN